MNIQIRMQAFLFAALLAIAGFFSPPAGANPITKDMVQRIETAHGAGAWYEKDLIAADIVVNFGGNERIRGKMITDPWVWRTRFDLENGTTLIFDGEKAWVSPADADFQSARFHLITWPYFLAAPMKLSDDGVNLQPMIPLPMHGKQYDAAKMTFGEGVSDAPDDWYILYADQDNHRLKALSYIVTYYSGKETDDAEPHAIVYNEFKTIDGVTLPMKWDFYNWSQDQGVYGDRIGHVTLQNMEFLNMDESLFRKPADAREDKLPQPVQSK